MGLAKIRESVLLADAELERQNRLTKPPPSRPVIHRFAGRSTGHRPRSAGVCRSGPAPASISAPSPPSAEPAAVVAPAEPAGGLGAGCPSGRPR